MVSFPGTEIVQDQYSAGVEKSKFSESFHGIVTSIEQIKKKITFIIVVVLAVPDVVFDLICVCS